MLNFKDANMLMFRILLNLFISTFYLCLSYLCLYDIDDRSEHDK